ncbi:ERI1 exoribonuclease 2-like isoform X3 [Panulirus ornatus]|uniref:ERI1 exoribonuclease 2-like isoform X3 n=1 Tax=Panulirus ornatus TaxID=150431 RepID=UPI003A8B9200
MATKRLALELGLMQKRHIQNVMKPSTSKAKQEFEYLVVLDFESTCWEMGPRVGQQEIIEFPAVLLDLSSGKIVSEFHQYVMPVEQPILSAFCRNLTDWDLGVCLHHECLRKQLKKPEFFNQWADIRLLYKKFYQRRPKGLAGALQDLGISFEGREHSGICDTRNTAVLISRMVHDGCIINITKSLAAKTTKVSNLKIKAQHLLHQVKAAMSNSKKEDRNGNNKQKRKLRESHANIETTKNYENNACMPCKTTCHRWLESTDHRNVTSKQRAVPTEKSNNVSMPYSSNKLKSEPQPENYVETEVGGQENRHNSSLNVQEMEAINEAGVNEMRFPCRPSNLAKSFKVTGVLPCKMKTLVQNNINSKPSGCSWNTPKLLDYRKMNSFKTMVTTSKNVANIPDFSVESGVSGEKRSLQSYQRLEFSEKLRKADLNWQHYKNTPPLCNCGRRAKLLITSKPGPNQGRHFFSCPLGKSESRKGCMFFKWGDEPYTKVLSFPTSYNTPVSNLNNLFAAQSLPPKKNIRESPLYANQRPKSEPVDKKQKFTATNPHGRYSKLPFEAPITVDVGRSGSSRMMPYQITPDIVKAKSISNKHISCNYSFK